MRAQPTPDPLPSGSGRHTRCSFPEPNGTRVAATDQRAAEEEDAVDYRDEYKRGRRYRGEGYYGGYYGYPGERRRQPDRRRGDYDRGVFERAGDEVRSWFGDEEAERRRLRDEQERPRGWGGPSRGWTAREERDDEDVDRSWARQWGYMEGRGRWESPPPRDMGPAWTRESAYGREGWGDPSAWGPEPSVSRAGEMHEGPHVGRGPRGYTRSDERIREDVCDRLCQHGF